MKTSYSARSSASSAAIPPRAKSATERPGRPPSARAERKTPAEERAGPLRLEPRQRPEALRARAGELVLGDREAPEILLRQVDAAELQVSRWVLEEVHELKTGADRVAHLHERGLVQAPVDAEHEPPHRIGRVRAVLANLVPGLVAGLALVDPVRLDQSPERLERQRPGFDRRVQAPHHLCLGVGRRALARARRGAPAGRLRPRRRAYRRAARTRRSPGGAASPTPGRGMTRRESSRRAHAHRSGPPQARARRGRPSSACRKLASSQGWRKDASDARGSSCRWSASEPG